MIKDKLKLHSTKSVSYNLIVGNRKIDKNYFNFLCSNNVLLQEKL